MSFLNKVAIVTGGSSGIGASIAAKLSAEGAFVAIVGRNQAKLAAVAEICKQKNNKPLIIAGDITIDDTAKKIVSETVNKFGKIDILVNNAGATNVEPSILYPKALQEFDNLMNLNVRSVVNLTNIAAPHLLESKGNIINISSIAGLRPYAATGFAYNTSKAALDHFTRSIAVELAAKGVRVNGINPGPVKTDILKNNGAEAENEEKLWKIMMKGTALGRISDAEEIADLVLFLASDKARGITGAFFVVDNGTTIRS
ncbi:hypothetical protein O0L34_g3774 [Tuta absoluta]|nr:hypothetical protein O0L34_g3774 [Tuta absoluta]